MTCPECHKEMNTGINIDFTGMRHFFICNDCGVLVQQYMENGRIVTETTNTKQDNQQEQAE